MNQKTINKEFTLKGVGLHNGINAELTVKPAKENSGIKFCRIDLDKNSNNKVEECGTPLPKNKCNCSETGCYQKTIINKDWFTKYECQFEDAIDASIINYNKPFTVYTTFTNDCEMTTYFIQNNNKLKVFTPLNI